MGENQKILALLYETMLRTLGYKLLSGRCPWIPQLSCKPLEPIRGGANMNISLVTILLTTIYYRAVIFKFIVINCTLTVPSDTTSDTSLPSSCAIKPSKENITKPANTLVAELARQTQILSL